MAMVTDSPGDAGPRVTHVIAPAPAGGAESVVLALAGARANRADVAVLLQTPNDHPFLHSARERGISVTAVPSGRRRYLAEARAVGAHAREHGTDLLHTHVYHADLVGYLAARRVRLPVVATVHGFTGGDWKNRQYERFNRWLLRRFDGVVVVSEPLKKLVVRSGVRADRVFLIPNGHDPRPGLGRVEARERLGLEKEGPTIGWVGRFSEEKGPDLLLSAVERMERRDLTVVFVGDGPERERLVACASTLPCEVRFIGMRPNTASLLAAFDTLVLSSRTEGTPMVLLEAMGAGVPVVAFAVGGIPDVLSVDAGWPVPVGDVGALADSISKVLAQPAEAARRSDIARKIVAARFSVENWMAQLEDVYATVL